MDDRIAGEAAKLATQAQDLATNLKGVAQQITDMAAQGTLALPDGHMPFVSLLTIFALACFVGYYVVWRVTPALHSPLMAVTNAVSSVIIVGALLAAGLKAVGAMRIQMTALPQLVAAFHSLVGLAAVFVAAAAFVSPDAFGIGSPGHIKTQSLIEMGLGTIIGAITFTGSVVAFAKLQGLVTGSPLVFRGQHPINALLCIALVVPLVWFAMRGPRISFLLLLWVSL